MNPCQNCKIIVKKQWLDLHLEKGLSVPEVSKLSGFHKDTLYIWKRRYIESGFDGLKDDSRAPRSHPNEYSQDIKEKIALLRNEDKGLCADIIKARLQKRYEIVCSRSGINKFLKNNGFVEEKKSRRMQKKARVRKYKIHEPGELLQIDIKNAFKSYAGYWYYQYTAIDYITNAVYADIFEIQSNLESILFAKAARRFYPFNVSGIQTDNASVFTNRYTGYLKSSDPTSPRLHPLDLFCEQAGISHFLIDKGKPSQNGKVERFHRTCEEKFYQRETFKDLNSARKKFRDFLYYCNNELENLGLNCLTPLEKLKTFPQYEHIKALK